MVVIKITSTSPEWPLIRQTPGSKGEWGPCKFAVDNGVEECDWWVIYEGVTKIEKTKVPKSNVILITGEPPSVKRYAPEFLKQFHIIITSHRDIKHRNVIHTQQALPWHVGRRCRGHENIGFSKDYDELKAMTQFKKEKTLSVICSDKAFTKGHRKRLAFVRSVQSYFEDGIDVFGRGLNEIEDKWDAIGPYKYHISLENISYRDYWTEKLSDAFLGGAYPFYWGCPNLENYFSRSSFTSINIEDVKGSIATIEKAIEAGTYEKSIDSIMQARNMVLDKYNLFPTLADFCGKELPSAQKEEVIIRPEDAFGYAHKGLNRPRLVYAYDFFRGRIK